MVAATEIMNRGGLTLQIAYRAHALITKYLIAASMYSCQNYYSCLIVEMEQQFRRIPQRDIRLSFRERIQAFPRTKRQVFPFGESLKTKKILSKILRCEANERRMGEADPLRLRWRI